MYKSVKIQYYEINQKSGAWWRLNCHFRHPRPVITHSYLSVMLLLSLISRLVVMGQGSAFKCDLWHIIKLQSLTSVTTCHRALDYMPQITAPINDRREDRGSDMLCPAVTAQRLSLMKLNCTVITLVCSLIRLWMTYCNDTLILTGKHRLHIRQYRATHCVQSHVLFQLPP